ACSQFRGSSAIDGMRTIRRTQFHLWNAGRGGPCARAQHPLAHRQRNDGGQRGAPDRYAGEDHGQGGPLFPILCAARPKTRFAGCPGPLDPKQAVLHGLSLRPSQGGRFTLYATNHGGRESIEVFEVDPSGAAPSASWIGCVLMPDKLAANSVAAFSDATLVATVLTLPGKTFQDAWAGRNTGVVVMWTPGSKEFRMLPGTEL